MAQSKDTPRRKLLTDFFQVTIEEPGAGPRLLSVLLFHRCLLTGDECECADDTLSGILLYGEGFETLSYYDGPPTLEVKGRPVVLPEPDGMLFILGPTFQLQRIEVRTSKLKHCFDEGKMNEFYNTEDWIDKLRPVLIRHEWSNWPHFSRN